MERRVDAHIARTQFGQIMTALLRTMSVLSSIGAVSPQ